LKQEFQVCLTQNTEKKTKQAETETESESESESKPENQKPKPNGVELEMEALGLKYFTGNLRKRNPTATICSTHFLRPRSLCEKSKSQKLNPIMPARGAHTYPYPYPCPSKIEKSDPHSRTATF